MVKVAIATHAAAMQPPTQNETGRGRPGARGLCAWPASDRAGGLLSITQIPKSRRRFIGLRPKSTRRNRRSGSIFTICRGADDAAQLFGPIAPDQSGRAVGAFQRGRPRRGLSVIFTHFTVGAMLGAVPNRGAFSPGLALSREAARTRGHVSPHRLFLLPRQPLGLYRPPAVCRLGAASWRRHRLSAGRAERGLR